jgi:hypothetical protein
MKHGMVKKHLLNILDFLVVMLMYMFERKIRFFGYGVVIDVKRVNMVIIINGYMVFSLRQSHALSTRTQRINSNLPTLYFCVHLSIGSDGPQSFWVWLEVDQSQHKLGPEDFIKTILYYFESIVDQDQTTLIISHYVEY